MGMQTLAREVTSGAVSPLEERRLLVLASLDASEHEQPLRVLHILHIILRVLRVTARGPRGAVIVVAVTEDLVEGEVGIVRRDAQPCGRRGGGGGGGSLAFLLRQPLLLRLGC